MGLVWWSWIWCWCCRAERSGWPSMATSLRRRRLSIATRFRGGNRFLLNLTDAAMALPTSSDRLPLGEPPPWAAPRRIAVQAGGVFAEAWLLCAGCSVSRSRRDWSS
jgi:hypothetical protein